MRIRTKRPVWQDWQIYVLLIPAVTYLFIFNYIPIYGVQISFRDFSPSKGIFGSDWVGLKYFKQFIEFPNFKLLIRNTLEIGLYRFAMFPVPIVFALMLNELRQIKFKKTVQLISYMPYFLSVVVVVSLLDLLLDGKTGVINSIIVALGGKAIDFLTVPSAFADIYALSDLWCSLGFGSIIYIAALSNVPMELVEAAKIDGANRFQVIWHVNIPAILPTIVIMLIFDCGAITSIGFEKVYLMQNALNLSRSQVISTYVYEVGLKGAQFSYSTAIGLFNNLINVSIILLVNKIAKKLTDVGIF